MTDTHIRWYVYRCRLNCSSLKMLVEGCVGGLLIVVISPPIDTRATALEFLRSLFLAGPTLEDIEADAVVVGGWWLVVARLLLLVEGEWEGKEWWGWQPQVSSFLYLMHIFQL